MHPQISQVVGMSLPPRFLYGSVCPLSQCADPTDFAWDVGTTCHTTRIQEVMRSAEASYEGQAAGNSVVQWFGRRKRRP